MSENFTVYVKKVVEFIPGVSFNVGTVQILLLFDLFLNFLD